MQNIINIPNNSLSILKQQAIKEEEVESFNQGCQLIDGFYKGHLISLVAKPNTGKTALAVSISKALSKQGMDVIYINADTTKPAARKYFFNAKDSGVSFLLPGIQHGLSIEGIKQDLQRVSNSGADMSNYIVIIDTLKKFTSMISKRELTMALNLFRELTGSGATVILLSHMNKYPTVEGEDIYEGCGDLIADTDDVIYLYSAIDKEADLLQAQLVMKKTRSELSPGDSVFYNVHLSKLECEIDPKGTDIAERKLAEQRMIDDQELISSIRNCLLQNDNAQMNQGDLIKAVREDTCILNRPVKEVLNLYTGKLWKLHKGPKNANLYTLIKVEGKDK